MATNPINPANPHWLMGQVRDGAVGIGPDWTYYATVRHNNTAETVMVPCHDQVMRLEDAGLVTLEPDGPVKVSTWARRLADRGELRATVAQVTFDAPNMPAAA